MTVEYVLIQDVNDSAEDAAGLAAIAKKLQAKVNLIPYSMIAITACSSIVKGKFIYKFFLPIMLLVQALRMVGRVVYTVWQVLTGDISVLDGLKSIGSAVFDFLATPFRWARDVINPFISMCYKIPCCY